MGRFDRICVIVIAILAVCSGIAQYDLRRTYNEAALTRQLQYEQILRGEYPNDIWEGRTMTAARGR